MHIRSVDQNVSPWEVERLQNSKSSSSTNSISPTNHRNTTQARDLHSYHYKIDKQRAAREPFQNRPPNRTHQRWDKRLFASSRCQCSCHWQLTPSPVDGVDPSPAPSLPAALKDLATSQYVPHKITGWLLWHKVISSHFADICFFTLFFASITLGQELASVDCLVLYWSI